MCLISSTFQLRGYLSLVTKLCLTLCDPWTIAHQLPYPWDFPDKNTGVGCHAILQRIFLAQGSNPRVFCLLQAGSIPLAPPGKPLLGQTLCPVCLCLVSDVDIQLPEVRDRIMLLPNVDSKNKINFPKHPHLLFQSCESVNHEFTSTNLGSYFHCFDSNNFEK